MSRHVGGSGLGRIVVVLAGVVVVCLALAGSAWGAGESVPWWGLTAGSRPSDLRLGVGSNEVQELTVSATGGMFFLGREVPEVFVAYNATRAELQAALDQIFPSREVLVEVVKSEVELHSWRVTFPDQKVAPIFATGEFLSHPLLSCAGAVGPCTATATVSQVAEGHDTGQILDVEAQNLGNVEAAGKVVVSDRVPAGLMVVAVEGVEGEKKAVERGEVTCMIVPSGREVTCSYEAGLPAFEQIEVLISVVVEGAKSGEVNEAFVSGGGATGVATATNTIEVNGAGGEQFGFEDVSAVPEDVGGGVDTQAGSHPFQFTTTFTARTTSESSRGVPRSVALFKDTEFELPPGFVGNPSVLAQCSDAQFATHPQPLVPGEPVPGNECPAGSAIGVVLLHYALPEQVETVAAPVFNMVPLPGEPARFGFVAGPVPAFINVSVRSGRDYGVTAGSHEIIQGATVLSVKFTLWGVPGSRLHDGQRSWECLNGLGGACQPADELNPPPFLIMPTSCEGPFAVTARADSWAYEDHASLVAEPVVYQLPSRVDGCDRLPFSPSIIAKVDVPDSSTSTGLTVDAHVPQTAELNAAGLAESSVKEITATLPEGVQINPAGGNGLEACSESLVGYEGRQQFASVPGVEVLTYKPKLPGSFGAQGAEATLSPGINFCSDASKVATVDIHSPLLPNNLKGAVYLASQNANPFGSLLAMYLVAEDPVSGTLVKLAGQVHLVGPAGQLVASFPDNPQLPFEDVVVHFFGGERAPLATPAHCGSYETQVAFVPWSAEAGDEAAETVHSTSTFTIEHGVNGGPCPPGQLPFTPVLHASSLNLDAGAFSPLSTTISRQDGEQNLGVVQLRFPPGLAGLIANVKPCGEQQANEGTCGLESLIGETTVSAGVGSDPVSVTGGKVYVTEKYHGAPFGLSIVNPVKSGPFDLEHDTANPGEYEPACDCLVVRARIQVDPHTAALTITTNSEGEGHAIPHLIDGIPVQIKAVNVTINHLPDFTFNPTTCEPMHITGSITSDEGATHAVEVPFQVTNCRTLGFAPKLTASTSAHTSKADGASLTVKVAYPAAPFGSQANIGQVKVELPKQLPSRLTTLQKACRAAQFKANPAGCPTASIVGHAKAITPLLPVPLEGPAYFVSNGGEAFPNLIVVLQGDNITVELVGDTFISKQGVTSSTFKTVPDAPVGSFQITLPEGPFSALAANTNLCKAKSKLKMPTIITAQDNNQIRQTTKITVAGCPKPHHKTKKHHKTTNPKP